MVTRFRRLAFATIACCLFALHSGRPASGDGIVVPPVDHDGRIAERAQEAILVLHANGRLQDLVLEIDIEADRQPVSGASKKARPFAWVVPFPNPPEVARADPGLFAELREHMSAGPDLRWSTLLRERTYGRGERERPVEVISRQPVGVYDVAVVRENRPDSLNRWLRENGFRTLDHSRDVIRDYREKGFVFACLKVREATLKPDEPALLHPLRFTFDTGRLDQLYFPMRLTGLQDRPFDVSLFVFHSGWIEERPEHGGYEPLGFRLRYRDWDLPGLGDAYGRDWTRPLSDPWLRPFTDRLIEVAIFMGRRHPDRRLYLTNLRAERLDPKIVRAWTEDLWLKTREGGNGCGGWFTRVESEHFRVLTMFGEDDARTWLANAERTYRAFQDLVGEPIGGDLQTDKIELIVTGSRRQEQIVATRYLPVRLVQRHRRPPSDFKPLLSAARRSGLHRRPVPEPPIAGWVRTGPESRDLSAYLAARVLFERYVNPDCRVAAWLSEGLGCLMEHRFIVPAPERPGSQVAATDAWLDQGASAWHSRVVRCLRLGGIVKFSVLKHDFGSLDTRVVDMGSTGRRSWTQAWSRMVFLTEEHPQRFARWIRSLRTGNRHWQEAMYAAFGWTDKEFDRSWKAWIRKTLKAGKTEKR
jgi:hypothetical protein